MKYYRHLILWVCLLSPWADAATLTAEDFLADPGVISVSLSPDGKHVATVATKDDFRIVRILTTSDKTLVSQFGDNIVRPFAVDWANNERVLVSLQVPYKTSKVRKDAERLEDFDIDDYFMFGRMISIDLKGENSVELLNDERSVKRNVNLATIPHYLPDDKDHVLMSGYRRERLSLFKVNVVTGESERVLSGTRRTTNFLIDNKGQVRYRYDHLPIAKTVEIYRLDGEEWSLFESIFYDDTSEESQNLDPDQLLALYQNKLVYRKQNEENGEFELWIADEDGKQQKPLVQLPNRSVRSLTLDRMTREANGFTVLSDVIRHTFFDKTIQTLYDKLAAQFEEENVHIGYPVDSLDKVLVYTSGGSNPGSYFLYDSKTENLAFLTYPRTKLAPEKLAAVAALEYKARDGLTIPAYLYLPPTFDGSKALPLVVMPHGGPHARDALFYNDIAQFIATRGYLVMKPNFRGSTGYGKAFYEAGFKQWGTSMQEDLEDAVDFLVKQQVADPEKVCIVGVSYGGYAALMGVVKTPDLYKCSVSINGVSHLTEQFDYSLGKMKSDRGRKLIYDSYGDPDKEQERMDKYSPALHTKKIKVPVLLVAGEDDDIVPIDQSEQMFDALEDTDNWVRMITLTETGHSIYHAREHVYDELEAFLATSLK